MIIKEFSGQHVTTLKVSGEKGFHREIWPLTKTGTNSSSGRRGSSGIKVVPGRYLVNLIVNDKTLETSFSVLPDPRVIEGGMTQADFQEQYDLCVKVQELQSRARILVNHVDSLWKPLEDKAEGRGQKAKVREKIEVLGQIKSQLVTAIGPYPQPMLSNQIGYLMSMISRVDQKPGKDAYLRYDELKQKLEKLEVSLAGL